MSGRKSTHDVSTFSRPGERVSLASRLTRLSLLEPTTREIGVRRLRWSALVAPFVVVALVLAVRHVARVERVLAAEGRRAQRVIVYELRPGGEVRAPIEPGTDVFRIVVHAFVAHPGESSHPRDPGNGSRGSLGNQPHDARIIVTARGNGGTRTDDLTIAAPSTTARVNPEDSDVVVGDPIGANLDVHGVGVGELSLSLASIDGADGLLVRVYRRDVLRELDAIRRSDRMSDRAREHMAHRAGEIDWGDTGEGEQHALLGGRWRKVAALREAATPARERAIGLASSSTVKASLDEAPAAVRSDVRGDERAAVVVHGRATLRIDAEGDVEAKLDATIRDDDGIVTTAEGRGTLSLSVPAGEIDAVEVARSSPGVVAIRSTPPDAMEPASHAVAWRTTASRPAVVAAGDDPMVLRLVARRPVARAASGTFPVTLEAMVRPPDAPAESIRLHAMRARDPYDRYDERDPTAAPTVPAVFHVMVPAGGVVILTPSTAPMDLSISELDPAAPPRVVVSRPAGEPPPPVARIGSVDWGGFAPRRPTNVATFEPEGRTLLAIPHRFIAHPPPEPRAPSFRVKRPEVGASIVRSGRVFDPARAAFEIDVPSGEALVLPVRVFAREPMDVVARIDGQEVLRRRMGAAERITTARSIAVRDEVQSTVVLGDDLSVGTHVLTFFTPPGKEAWVHLPWIPKARLPGTPPREPHWLEGDLDD